MKPRHYRRTKNGQLAALAERTSPAAQAKRQAKAIARADMATQLRRQQAMLQGEQTTTRNVVLGFLTMNPWNRLKWILFGAALPGWRGNVALSTLFALLLIILVYHWR